MEQSKIMEGNKKKWLDEEEERRRCEIFDKFFDQTQTELILFVCTYNSLLMLDNKARDKVILRVKYSEILYIMGKNDRLKISMTIPKQVMNMNQAAALQNTEDSMVDVRLEFVMQNARTMAEDILSYCQMQLMELTPEKEVQSNYIEFGYRIDADL